MKKNLFSVFSLVALAMGVASCSSDDLVSTPLDKSQQNVAQFGTRSTDISMYLGKVQIPQSRGVDVNANMWSFMPEYPTQEEKDGILAYVPRTQTLR